MEYERFWVTCLITFILSLDYIMILHDQTIHETWQVKFKRKPETLKLLLSYFFVYTFQ